MPEFNPIQELSQIKDQLDSLKKSISNKVTPVDINLLTEISTNLNKVLAIFQHASEVMEKASPEDAEGLKEAIEEIEEENKSIAKGIVVLAEMIKERLPEKHHVPIPPHIQPKPMPSQSRPIPPPKMIQPGVAPPPHIPPRPMPSPQMPLRPTPQPFFPSNIPESRPMPPPLRPSPAPIPQLRREAPSLEEMPPPPRPPPEITGIPLPSRIPGEKPEKKSLFGKLFKK